MPRTRQAPLVADVSPAMPTTTDRLPSSPPPQTKPSLSSMLKLTRSSLRSAMKKRGRSNAPLVRPVTSPATTASPKSQHTPLEISIGSVPRRQPATGLIPRPGGEKEEPEAVHNGRRPSHHVRREMPPSFLGLSRNDARARFIDITWAEMMRSVGGATGDGDDSPTFAFPDTKPGQEGMDRYSNIRPWDHNRIKLRVPEGSLDYVNASPIVVSPPPKSTLKPLRYIAMQGPTPRSRDSVWRMVAEQLSNPAVIVQLTNMTEGGSVKCSQYFPSASPPWQLNEADSWHDSWAACLRHEQTDVLLDGAIERRKLVFRVEGEPDDRIVWHFLYTKWPDFGVPAAQDVGSFLELMRLSREHNTADTPRIIHCSAGVGRTGTFIALEHLIRELEAGSFAKFDEGKAGESEHDPVYSTVDQLRQQRKTMVQSELQYLFIYRVLIGLWAKKYNLMAAASNEDEHDEQDGEPAPKRQEM